MDGLGGALEELARDVGPGEPVDPAALWRHGRRRVRVRRALGASLAAVLALLVVGVGASFTVTGEPFRPAVHPHVAGLPRAVHPPPGWLGQTSGRGAFARLAVLGAATRGGRLQLFGISATTGEYRFLDLPNLATTEGAALSPDGSRVAFWSSDGVSGKPFPTLGQKVVSGLSVLDLGDGSVHEISPSTEHGLGVETIRWLDRSRLLFVYGQKVTATATTGIRAHTWTPPDADTYVQHDDLRKLDLADASRNRDGTLLVPGEPWTEVDTSLRPTTRVVHLPHGQDANFSAASLSGRRIAAVGHLRGGGADELYTGKVGAGGEVSGFAAVGEVRVGRFLGWTGADTVLVNGWKGPPAGTTGLLVVDLDRGTVHRLGEGGDDVDSIVGIATDLLERPFVDGRRPPSVDPRWVRAGAGGVLVLAVLAVLGVLWWRRRGAA